jgi:hypothetical protein
MNEDEAQRIRDAIARDQTTCRCGHLLAACADCMGWMRENSLRIATAWEWWYIKAVELGVGLGQEWGADAAEADDLAYFEGAR